jgi:hypothetical protein
MRFHSLLIVAPLIAASAVLLAYEGHTQSNPPTPPTQAEQQTAPTSPTPSAPNPQAQPEYYEASCRRPKTREDAELCEQRRSAQAAEDAVWWAAFQTKLGVAGFITVLLSLIFTGWAAIAASRAARAAADSVKVARTADRPHFTPRNPELRNFAGDWEKQKRAGVMTVHFDIENIGKSVGFFRTYGVQHEITPIHIPTLGQNEPQQIGAYHALPIRPDAKFVTPLSVHGIGMTEENYVAILNQEKSLHIYGSLRYSDLFGITRRTGFTFEFIPDPNNPPLRGCFVMSPSPLWYDTEEEPDDKRESRQKRRRPF